MTSIAVRSQDTIEEFIFFKKKDLAVFIIRQPRSSKLEGKNLEK